MLRRESVVGMRPPIWTFLRCGRFVLFTVAVRNLRRLSASQHGLILVTGPPRVC